MFCMQLYCIKSFNFCPPCPLDKLVNARYDKLRGIGAACIPASQFPPAQPKPEITDRLSLKAQLDKTQAPKPVKEIVSN